MSTASPACDTPTEEAKRAVWFRYPLQASLESEEHCRAQMFEDVYVYVDTLVSFVFRVVQKRAAIHAAGLVLWENRKYTALFDPAATAPLSMSEVAINTL
ncbi:hypothetical protein MRX96_007570 [Rhipicephalus microplus]